MRRFLILFLAACTACAAWAAPRITPDGEILCGVWHGSTANGT